MDENKNTPQGEIGGFDAVQAEPSSPTEPTGFVLRPEGSSFATENPVVQPTSASGPEEGTHTPEENVAPAAKEPENTASPEESSYTPNTPQYGFLPNGNYGVPSYSAPQYTPPAPPQKPQRVKKPKKERVKNYTLTAVLLSAALACLIGVVGGAGAVLLIPREKTDPISSAPMNDTPSPSQGTQNIVIETQVESMVEAVYQKSGNCVVGISTTSASMGLFGGSTEQTTGEGSGIIYTTDGYIITHYPVISPAVESSTQSKIQVYLPTDTDTAIPASVVGYNISSDLAVIKIEKTGLPAVEIGDSNTLRIGQYVVAIGNPGGLSFMGSTSFGIISGLNREITIESVGTMSLIQTDAAINPGNSGGALLNTKGQLVGVNSVKFVDESYEGMGFSIPVNTVVEICNNIIKNKDEPSPYIGIEISTRYSATTLQMLGYPAGAVVQSVYAGGPAAESGIQRGDIITEFNSTAVTSYSQMNGLINSCHPGDVITIKLYRSGKYYTTSLTVGSNNEQ